MFGFERCCRALREEVGEAAVAFAELRWGNGEDLAVSAEEADFDVPLTATDDKVWSAATTVWRFRFLELCAGLRAPCCSMSEGTEDSDDESASISISALAPATASAWGSTATGSATALRTSAGPVGLLLVVRRVDNTLMRRAVSCDMREVRMMSWDDSDNALRSEPKRSRRNGTRRNTV